MKTNYSPVFKKRAMLNLALITGVSVIINGGYCVLVHNNFHLTII